MRETPNDYLTLSDIQEYYCRNDSGLSKNERQILREGLDEALNVLGALVEREEPKPCDNCRI